jgi:hypothetical protein
MKYFSGLFRFFRRRPLESDLPDDVMEAINQIYEKHIDYSAEQRGYITARKWKKPLTPEQEKELLRVCPK